MLAKTRQHERSSRIMVGLSCDEISTDCLNLVHVPHVTHDFQYELVWQVEKMLFFWASIVVVSGVELLRGDVVSLLSASSLRFLVTRIVTAVEYRWDYKLIYRWERAATPLTHGMGVIVDTVTNKIKKWNLLTARKSR